MSKSQAMQYILANYIQNPQEYSPLLVRELREPMTYSISVLIPEQLQKILGEIAVRQKIKSSEVLRQAIYQELIING